ncbi:MAG: hypothetical protein LBT09_03400, partial [Planctomycetaceae bacterium]|nr:hypothetical protein [Planctomycetaceae bacterium]
YPYNIPRYLKDGRIDVDFLLRDFQEFWRINSDMLQAYYNNHRYNYYESIPHLVLMAFLQRVINGGGEVRREMATGSGSLDLYLVYHGQKYPIEAKLRHSEYYVNEGINRTTEYMDILGCKEGWVVVFDRDKNLTWDEKIFMKKEIVNGKTITIVGA